MTLRPYVRTQLSEEVRLVRTCPRGVGEGDTIGIGVRRFRTTFVRTYLRRFAPWPDNLKTARSAVDPQSFLRAGPWAHIQVSGHTRLGLPGPGICDVKALGFKLRRFMRTRVDRAFRDQRPRA